MGSTVASLGEKLSGQKGNNTVIRMAGDVEKVLKVVEEWLYEVDDEAATRYADSLLSALLNNL